MAIPKRQTAGIKEAKAHLGRYLDLVEQGTEVIVTRHGRPVGKIVPCHNGGRSLKERLHQLERTGLIKKRSAVAGRLPEPFPLKGIDAQQLLQEDRGE